MMLLGRCPFEGSGAELQQAWDSGDLGGSGAGTAKVFQDQTYGNTVGIEWG